uniref:Uncharacterized protein n=1 Tax=Arundo donax TaxID=35708 RepID=A0A0A9TSQ7_ARUDO
MGHGLCQEEALRRSPRRAPEAALRGLAAYPKHLQRPQVTMISMSVVMYDEFVSVNN